MIYDTDLVAAYHFSIIAWNVCFYTIHSQYRCSRISFYCPSLSPIYVSQSDRQLWWPDNKMKSVINNLRQPLVFQYKLSELALQVYNIQPYMMTFLILTATLAM